MVAVGTVNPLSLRLGRFDSYTAHQFWEGYLAPPLKGSYEYPLKEQKTKYSKLLKISSQFNFENLNLVWLNKFTEDRLQQNLNNLFLGKEKAKVRFLHSADVELV